MSLYPGARPTMQLKFIDGKLHQLWQSRLYSSTEGWQVKATWVKVPSE